jgi:thioredoxin-related protein
MKKYILPTLLTIIIGFTSLHAGDKAEIKWRKFDAGLTEAKKSNKKVFIDVYTDWCKWCKKLDAEVYTDKNVVDYINKYYIPVKMNGESGENVKFKDKSYTEATLSQAFGVSGFPTLIFLASNGDPIEKIGSFLPSDQFLQVAEFIGEDHYKKTKWEDFVKQKSTPAKKGK